MKGHSGPPRYHSRHGWMGGDARTLYTFTDTLTGAIIVRPGAGPGNRVLSAGGDGAVPRVATRAEAETHWQRPLHPGWTVKG